jgi:hypothetical protein
MKTVLTIVLAIMLAGCTTTAKDVETAMQRNLPSMCRGAELVHATFLTVAPTLTPKQVRLEANAYAAIAVFCVNPETITIPDVIARAAAAYATYISVSRVGT